MISDSPRDKSRKQKKLGLGGVAVVLLLMLGVPAALPGLFQHSTWLAPSSTFWELPPKPNASLSHTLTERFGFQSCPAGKRGDFGAGKLPRSFI